MTNLLRSACRTAIGMITVVGLVGSAQAEFLHSTGDGFSIGTEDTRFTVESAWGSESGDLTDKEYYLQVGDPNAFPVNSPYANANGNAQWLIFASDINHSGPDNFFPDTETVTLWVKTVFEIASINDVFSGRLAADNKVEMFLNGDPLDSRTDSIATNPDPLGDPHNAGYSNPTNWSFDKNTPEFHVGENTLWFKVTNLPQSGGNPSSLLFETTGNNQPGAPGPTMTTPEPGTLSLLALGGIGFAGGVIRRRRAKTA